MQTHLQIHRQLYIQSEIHREREGERVKDRERMANMHLPSLRNFNYLKCAKIMKNTQQKIQTANRDWPRVAVGVGVSCMGMGNQNECQ